MKRWITITALMVVTAVMGCLNAFSGDLVGRIVFNAGTNCIGSWTNNYQYKVIELERVGVVDSLTATNVVTWVRITASNSVDGVSKTQEVASVTCASGIGVDSSITWEVLKYGDILKATGIDAATGAASNTFKGMVEFRLQD